MKDRDRLLELLIRESYRRGKVKLASGKESDFYIDVRQTALHPEGNVLIGQLLFEQLRDISVAAVGGMAVGAVPIVSALIQESQRQGTPLSGFFIRREAKEHGMKKRVEGRLRQGDTVAIVEDVVTTGGSTIDAVEATRAGGGEIVMVLAVVDRCEGGAEKIRAAGVPFKALFERKDFPAS